MSNSSFDTIANTMGMESQSSANTMDDDLPPAINPVMVSRSNRTLTVKESDQWMTTFLEQGADLLGDAITIAKETRNPRAIEVAHKLLKDLFDTSADLNRIRKEEASKVTESKVTKNSISVTPAQLLGLLKTNATQTPPTIIEPDVIKPTVIEQAK